MRIAAVFFSAILLSGQDNVNTTPSGLKYVDHQLGTGEEATAGNNVSVHYTGWLYTEGKRGAQFDTSLDRGPFEFPLGGGRVIKGWDEGVQGMKVGGKRELFIPPELAYGARNIPGIPANSTLDFEVELLKVSPRPKVTSIDQKIGDGAVAVAGATITVHYTGWLYANGKRGAKFDSSLDSGEPFQFRLGAGEVIPGWDQGVQGMQVGGKRELIIPPDLAYGPRGAGGVIPPNATLDFEVELLTVTPR
jgi:FKBP-type peptidyl-prolyl cis-trans isomerase